MMSLVREIFKATFGKLARNAECGMWSAEYQGERRGARPRTYIPHSALRIPHSLHLVRLLLVRPKTPCHIVRQRMRVIERAGVQPHAPRAQGPGVPHGAGEQVLAEATPDRVAHDSEIRDLDGVVVGDAPQLVPAEEAAVAPGDVQGDRGIGEVAAQLGVGPVPPVPPVVRFAHGAVALAVERGRRGSLAGQHDVVEIAEYRLELARRAQLQVCAGRLHQCRIAVWAVWAV